MEQKLDKSAREKIIRARTNLLVSNGFFGFLAMQLRLVEATEHMGHPIDTMAVDGRSIFYNPTFTHKLDEREVEGVLAHEVMHCCFQHFARRGSRDPMGWNIAGDHVINNDLVESGFTLPKPNCCDPKYKNMTTEEVYELLPKIYISVAGGGTGDGDGKSDPGGCGGVLDAPGDTNAQEEAKQTWETSVRQAVAVAKGNNPGHIPGSLQRLINELQRPKVSWRDLTRNFIDQSMTKEISWSRISRRSVSVGALMPGLISDRLNQLIMIVDISGSISHKLAVEMVSEAAGALDQGTCDELVVLYADTEVRNVDRFVPGDIVKCATFDGGGTDFRESFKWVSTNAPNASCVIYLTDLQVYEFGEDPGCPTLWACYGPSQHYDQLIDKVPFGQGVHVSNSYG